MKRDKVKENERLEIMNKVEGRKKGPGNELLLDNQ